MQILVTMSKEWIGPPDPRGDAVIYGKGWRGEMPDDEAAFVIAVDYAKAAYELPADVAAAVALLREVVAHFRTVERVEPTFSDVYDAVARLDQSFSGAA